jgi:hypothetical protein
MKLKNTLILLLIVALIVIVAGCSGSKPQDTADTSNNAPTTPTSSVVSQDDAWQQNVQTNSALLSTDLKNIQAAISDTNNPDFATLGNVGQNLIDDAQKALNDNDKYTVVKYKDEQKEWVLALQDSVSAGKSAIAVSNDGKNSDSVALSKDAKEYVIYEHSASAHLNRAATLRDNADKTG